MVGDKAKPETGGLPMGCYQHLSIEERESILVMTTQGKTIREIGRILGRSASTISRELQRNTRIKHPYSAVFAQRVYHLRRKRCKRKRILEKDEVKNCIVGLLEKYWSPEQISNRLKKEKNPIQIGTSTIYRALSSGLIEKAMQKKLRRKGQRHSDRLPCGHLPIQNTIHDRPVEANTRQRLGDWECDTVRGAHHSGCVATLVDRKSRYTVCAKLPNRTAKAFNMSVIQRMNQEPELTVLTLTCDQGKEFAKFKELENSLQCTVYFADPGRPDQRGTNENTNGLLRQFLPKRTRFTSITQGDVDAFAQLLNLRPRKCLNWLSPFEVFFHSLLHFT